MSDDAPGLGTLKEAFFESGAGTRFLYASATSVAMTVVYFAFVQSDWKRLVELDHKAFWLILADRCSAGVSN